MAYSQTQTLRRRAPRDFLGHPRGLAFLFSTEMWERFSYYGMRSLLVLYMVKFLLLAENADKVIGLAALRSLFEGMFGPLAAQPFSSHIYGLYTGLVYFTPFFGGLIADRVLGQHKTIVIGASLMAIGHFMMAFEPLFLFALIALILGNGCFKPNMSAQVGTLYQHGDPRRDRAYSIFYVGINLGAFLAPLVCGTLGQEVGWHYGFGAAGIGMVIGLLIYLYALSSKALPMDEFHRSKTQGDYRGPLDRIERRAVIALLLLFLPNTLFWATYEQQGNTIALARRDPDHLVPGLQPVHDLRLHAIRRGAMGATGQARHGAIEHQQNGARLFWRYARQHHHGGRRLAGGRGAGRKLAVALRLFRRHHHRRALSVAGRALAGIEGRTRPHGVDDDGRLARHELRRQFHRRLARQLLEQHGQNEFLSDDSRCGSARRRRHRGLQPAAGKDFALVSS
jgi:POT family